MRILQLTSHLKVGGIARYVVSVSERLSQRGHQVILASDGGGLGDELKGAGVGYWRLPLDTSAEFSPQVFQARRQLQKYLRQQPVDIIHAHTRVAQVVADRLSDALRIPYVTTWHGIYKARLGRRLWPCTGDFTIAISQPVREHLLNDFHIPKERIRLIYNGIDTDRYSMPAAPGAIEAYRARHGILSGQPVIGCVGRLASGRVKGFDLVLVAACLLKQQKLPGLQVLLAGDGPRCPFLKDVARRLGIQESVHFVGAADDVRLPLAAMDLFLFPSRWPEAFGLTLVEAMASGKPVVATRMGAVSEIVQHGISGWLVPPNDPASLAEAIAHLLEDRKLAFSLGRQAQERAKEAFSLERMTSDVEAVYKEMALESSSFRYN